MTSNAFDCAVRLLSRREHGAHELSTKLQQKGYEEAQVIDALKKCQHLSLQSDVRFVESFCRAQMQKGYGPIRIRKALQALKVDSELILSTLQQEDAHWQTLAFAVWKKKFKTSGDGSFAAVQKQKQFLLYRGFSADTIAAVFRTNQRLHHEA